MRPTLDQLKLAVDKPHACV